MVLWSESDPKSEAVYQPDSILVHTEFENLASSRFKVFQKLIRKSDHKVICESNSFCILFDPSGTRLWKDPEPLFIG